MRSFPFENIRFCFFGNENSPIPTLVSCVFTSFGKPLIQSRFLASNVIWLRALSKFCRIYWFTSQILQFQLANGSVNFLYNVFTGCLKILDSTTLISWPLKRTFIDRGKTDPSSQILCLAPLERFPYDLEEDLRLRKLAVQYQDDYHTFSVIWVKVFGVGTVFQNYTIIIQENLHSFRSRLSGHTHFRFFSYIWIMCQRK